VSSCSGRRATRRHPCWIGIAAANCRREGGRARNPAQAVEVFDARAAAHALPLSRRHVSTQTIVTGVPRTSRR